MAHILERWLIHFFSSAGVYLLVWFLIQWLTRRWPQWFNLVLPAALIIGFIGWNEVGNLHDGQAWIKVFTDLSSWVIGLGVSVWGLRRFRGV